MKRDCGNADPNCIEADNDSPVIPWQPGKKLPVVKRQKCTEPGCLDIQGEEIIISGKHGEKQAIVRRDDEPQPAGDDPDCPEGGDCMERQKKPVKLPGTPRENKLIDSVEQHGAEFDVKDSDRNRVSRKRQCEPGTGCIEQQEETVETEENLAENKDNVQDNPVEKQTQKRQCEHGDGCVEGKDMPELHELRGNSGEKTILKRACGMPGQPNCVDIQGIVKQEEPIAITVITLKRRCPPETGCIEIKEKDEEPENTPGYTSLLP